MCWFKLKNTIFFNNPGIIIIICRHATAVDFIIILTAYNYALGIDDVSLTLSTR